MLASIVKQLQWCVGERRKEWRGASGGKGEGKFLKTVTNTKLRRRFKK
jgi:hypothetical protein